jgi:myo-inositol-hexaphosphate 3-phosphohydrolase
MIEDAIFKLVKIEDDIELKKVAWKAQPADSPAVVTAKPKEQVVVEKEAKKGFNESNFDRKVLQCVGLGDEGQREREREQ